MLKENLFNYGLASFTVSEKNKHLAFSYKDKTEINIFKMKEIYNLDEFELIFKDINYLISPTYLEYSKNGNNLVSISQDKNIFIYKFIDNKYILNICLINGLLKSPTLGTWNDDNFFVLACSEGSLYYSEYDKEQNMWIGNIFKSLKGSILVLKYNNNKDKICVGGTDKMIRVINANKKNLSNKDFGETLFKIKTNHWVFNGFFNFDDSYLIINDFNNLIQLINLRTNKVENELKYEDNLALNKGNFISKNEFVLSGFNKRVIKFEIGGNKIKLNKEIKNLENGYFSKKELNNINKLQLEQLKKFMPKEIKLDKYHLKEVNKLEVLKNCVITSDSKGCIQFWENK